MKPGRIAACLWAAPCTAVGLCLVAPAFLFGAQARLVEGTLEVALGREAGAARIRRRLPFSAITFGHLVAATRFAELDRLRRHEQAHVRQYERWGLLFFVAYPAESLLQWLRGRRPYIDNRFEVQAREAASRASGRHR